MYTNAGGPAAQGPSAARSRADRQGQGTLSGRCPGDPDHQDRGSQEEEPQGRHRKAGDARMQKKLTCRAMGMNCGFEVRDESEEEILAALGDHAKRVHKVEFEDRKSKR